MNYSQNLINFLKKEETYSPVAKYDNGNYAIGYGHNNSTIRPGQRTTPEEAEKWLIEDIQTAVSCINRNIKHQLTQGQFDALVSLAFNIGCSGFLKTAAGVAAKEGRLRDIEQWLIDYKNPQQSGLERRRRGELALFRGNNVESLPAVQTQTTNKEKWITALTIAATSLGLIYTGIAIIQMLKPMHTRK